MIDYQIGTSQLSNVPFTLERIENLIDSVFVSNNELFVSDQQVINLMIETLLLKLNEISSLHKFIANVTMLIKDNINNTDITIKSLMGASWNDEKDGVFNYKVDLNSNVSLLISIIWIAK